MAVALTTWKSGRGLLGPLRPVLGVWVSPPEAQEFNMPMRCTRTLRTFGKGWIELDARWDMGSRGEYRELAFFGAMSDGALGFHSFTNDGKRSEGRLADGTDVHADAIAFEAKMPAGLARMIYWPLATETGFNFAVESRTNSGWNRFLRQEYRPFVSPNMIEVP
jgi:hypothetical protein